MSAVTFEETSPELEQFVDWYRKRPTQLAFAASLALHALLIAVIPGFRSVPLETPTVLTVRIVNQEPLPEPVINPQPVSEPEPVPVPEPVSAAEPVPAPEPVIRREELLPEPVVALEFVPPVPQPRVIEQT